MPSSRTLSIYDSDRRWLATWTIPAKAHVRDVLRDALAHVPECERPAYYRVGTSGDLREVKP